jgi:biopolymer transport protein ExbD
MIEKNRQREDPEIGGAGMADIAFLLLIFFLLVTTIDIDTGIGLQLPPKSDEDPPPIKTRNMMKILVNAQGMVMMGTGDPEATPVQQVKQKLMDFITNRGQDPNLSESPDNAIVSIQTQQATPYNVYIDMLDEVMGAYAELRNQAAQSKYGRPYESFEDESEQKKEIQELYPKKISIAEPAE